MAPASAALPGLPDEILEEIFLCLDAAADLSRASAACSSFRRIVSAPRFLRRLMSLRSPAVLGFIGYPGQGFLPVEPPHRSAPEARALVQAADFTLSFLPDPYTWRFRHALNGRVLLSSRFSVFISSKDFLVCDPLHRRYIRIPRIPDDLVASALHRVCTHHSGPVLAPAGENDEEESFRVIFTVQFKAMVMSFVFSSCNQTWRGITTTICLPHRYIGNMPYYAQGCFYWIVDRMGYLLMLDTSEKKFSIIDLPPHDHESERAMVEAEEGRLGLLTIRHGTIDLYCRNWQSNGGGAQEWQHDKLIPLPKYSDGIDYSWEILGTAGHYLALLASKLPNKLYFVLDIKTLLLEKLCTTDAVLFYGYPYARFPPPLALPTI